MLVAGEYSTQPAQCGIYRDFTALQQAEFAQSGPGKRHPHYPSGLLRGLASTSPCNPQGKRHKTTTILQIGDLAGCFNDRFNDILPVVRSKIVDKYNIPLN
jgi:hypothetical protein